MLKQRSNEWFDMREGRFTASQIGRLLGKETLATTKQSINTYALEKAIETIYGREEDGFTSIDMQRGIDLEPLAFKRFTELKNHKFLDVSESTFISYGDHAGASPDGKVSDNSNLEIKCPRRNKFFKIVANGFSEIDASYIAQMQMQMLCSKTDRTYFFNYYIENSIEYWHEIVVNRDDVMIELIKKRIIMATEIKLDYIRKITENIQC
jgi:putative phage-type endonuclease